MTPSVSPEVFDLLNNCLVYGMLTVIACAYFLRPRGD